MIINCKKVVKHYSTKLVLDKVDLEVKQGEFFGLVGINGSGKSTLIKSILDLVGIDDGSIKINNCSNREVTSREDIAFLPDRFSPPTHLTANDFIQYMLKLHASNNDQKKIDSVLDGLALDKPIMKESVSKLSKGMTQKLGLASCLLSGKKLLILDEPMSGLDPGARVLFKEELKKLKEKGSTIFFSSHMLADVEELADRVAVLHNKKIVFTGSPDDFKSHYKAENVEQAFMECIA